ncbi:3'-5' exonuclease domain-containing protein 2 [Marinilabiliaceae bacterium JC017]|nr:3'-5' exonuclease domain-containing protein 2 [Marinilabiliaceae bacterium JC017]
MHKTISKEAISELPLQQFKGLITVVDNVDDVEQYAELLKKETVIGFDTETKPSFRKGKVNKVALLQLSTSKNAYLFRLNKTGLPKCLTAILAASHIKKVGVGIRDDIRGLQKLSAFEPAGFVELQDVAKGVGIEDFSLKKLAGLLLNVRISKKQRLSNWETEIFSEGQMIYAATDAWVAKEIYNELQQQYPQYEIQSITK